MLRRLLPILAMGLSLPGCFDIFGMGSEGTDSEEDDSQKPDSDLETIGVYDVEVVLEKSD